MSGSIFSEDQLRRHDLDDLKRFLRLKLGGYGVVIRDLGANTFYRGVVCPERPETVGRISYPPAQFVTSLGRVNRIGRPVFYCSCGAPSVFFELRAKAGDLIALSTWSLAEPLWMHHLGYHEDSMRRLGAPTSAMRSSMIRPIPGETPENARMRRQLSLAFTKDVRPGQEHLYKQSIVIHELLFDRAEPLKTHPDGPRFDRAAGTAYPALQMRGAADNVALWPEFVDSSLRLRRVLYVRVEAADPASSSYSLLTVGISREFPDGHLVWQERLPPEGERRSHIDFIDGAWIMRDGAGRVYDRHF